MHYTGMSSAQFVCIASKQPPVWAIGGDNLPILVFAVAGMVLVVLSWNVLGLVGNTGAARAAAGTRSAPGAARKVAAKG
jgi:hypothetical protein